MPRKKSPTGKLTDVAGVELQAVRVELKPDVHYQLRLESAKKKMSMAAYVRGLIEGDLSKKGGK